MSERGPQPPRGGGKKGGGKSGGGRPAGSAKWRDAARSESRGESRGDSRSGPRGAKSANPRGPGGKKPVHRQPPEPKGVPAEPMRIQRAVARVGLASRREADRLVAEGRVRVNGEVALIGQVINPATDVITLDGEPVARVMTSTRWFLLNKPAGVMTTKKDPEGRRTVFDFVENVPGLTYVGRLDFMTEGVLLLTTDGTAAHALTHPSNEVERTYVATVRGDVTAAVKAARRGVELDDGLVMPTEVSAAPLGNRRWAFEITISEGRNHEIRRLCAALGLEVEHLVRTRFGPVRLGELPVGESRALSPKERSVLETFASTRS